MRRRIIGGGPKGLPRGDEFDRMLCAKTRAVDLRREREHDREPTTVVVDPRPNETFAVTPHGEVRIDVEGGHSVLAHLAGSYVQEMRMPDTLPVIGSAVLLLSAAIIASLLPAVRAARVDVVQALRSE